MIPFVIRRLLALIPMLFGISIIIFLVLHLIPGDPARIVAGVDAAEEDVQAIRTKMGFDKPLYIQYLSYVKKLLKGDMGRSLRTRRPVLEEILMRLIATMELTAASMIVAVMIGIPAGVISAVKNGYFLDRSVMVGSVLGISMPIFFLGLLLMLIFSAELKWLPPTGRGTLQHLILPSITLGFPYVATFARLTRSSMLEVIMEDYVRTARAKGLSEKIVIYKHALKNALIPIVTVLGLNFGRLLGGAVITETVFAWPGMGRYMVEGILLRDIFVVQGAILFFATFIVLANLVVDLIYGLIDPRITYH